MTIALMKQIWGSGKPGPTLYCCGGQIFLSFGGRIIQVALVVAILNTYCHLLCIKHGIQPRGIQCICILGGTQYGQAY